MAAASASTGSASGSAAGAGFFEAQIQALMAAGVDRFDAERTVGWVEQRAARLGDVTKDPLPAEVLEPYSAVTEADIVDAMADWMASPAIPNKYKRLLHARVMSNDSKPYEKRASST